MYFWYFYCQSVEILISNFSRNVFNPFQSKKASCTTPPACSDFGQSLPEIIWYIPSVRSSWCDISSQRHKLPCNSYLTANKNHASSSPYLTPDIVNRYSCLMPLVISFKQDLQSKLQSHLRLRKWRACSPVRVIAIIDRCKYNLSPVVTAQLCLLLSIRKCKSAKSCSGNFDLGLIL